jgi:HNH endonuclease
MPFVDDLPSKSQIFEYWKECLFKLGFFIDWGEPSCWACGFCYDDKYDVTNPDTSWNETLRRWDKIPLQRCHIIARSLGGSNDPANLFLMCRECHDLMPNTTVPDVFFEWARTQSYWRRDEAKIRAALESFGRNDADLEALTGIIRSKEFRSWSREKVGLHRPQSNYASRLSRLTPATLIGLAIQYQRESAKAP